LVNTEISAVGQNSLADSHIETWTSLDSIARHRGGQLAPLVEFLRIWAQNTSDEDIEDVTSLEVLSQLFASLEKAPVEIIFMAAATQEEIDAVIAKNGWKIKGLQADATVVKTIMRANPGIMLLKDGVVVGKYHHNNTPEALEVLDLF
jgi:hypothetical protein